MKDNADRLYKIRHSLAHVMAQAILEIRPKAKLAFGPPVDNGCYYDFDLETPLTPEDFKGIEKSMRKIIGQRQPFVESKRSVAEAVEHLKQRGEGYKVEYCLELAEKGETEIGFFTNGPFEDMCAGPHVNHTGEIPPDCFSIDTLAGAYWRGDEKNKQLTRVYLLAFENKDELKSYIDKRELAREREHRKLGKELDLFSIDHEGVGPGLILWHPKGAIIRHIIEDHSRKMHLDGGYDFVYSPHIGRSTLWETSGHLSFYKDGMFAPIEVEEQQYYLKPMNCPFHCKIFDSTPKSYRDLPKRFAEWGTVYRFERSGTLSGLTRVRGFTQDDAHLFCREDQMPAEIDKVLSFSVGLLRDFGLKDFILYLSTRPPQRVGAEEKWDAAESALKAALERSGLPYALNEGDGAFYGPKIDICAKDTLDRQWQLSTIQFDFNLPERFDLSYTDADGAKKRPYMIHRALMGSIERFFAILVEHFGGAFPTWLAPVQVMLIPVNESCEGFVKDLAASLNGQRFRTEVDLAADSFNKKIRNAVTRKIPNILIVGNKEVETNSVTLRRYCVKEQVTMTVDQFRERLVRLRDQRVMDSDPSVVV